MSNQQFRPIWTSDDFDATVRDAVAVVEAGRRRRHLAAVADTERVIRPRIVTQSRERKARRMDALAVALLLLLAAALGCIVVLASAPSAKADVDSEAVAYAAHYAQAVCQTVSEYPTVTGLQGVMAGMVEQGLTSRQAGQAAALSIYDTCPQYSYLVDLFVARYNASQIA